MAGARLYTPEILALATALADHPLRPEQHLRGEASSRVCGGRIVVGLGLASDERIETAGAQVTACAVGQAAAAVFLRGASGRDAADVAGAHDAITAWLADGGGRPDWPGLDTLVAARDHAGRHGAILLPWKAALVALSNPAPPA